MRAHAGVVCGPTWQRLPVSRKYGMLHKLQPSFVYSTMMLGGQVGVDVTDNLQLGGNLE